VARWFHSCVVWCVLLCASPAFPLEASERPDSVVWTAIIPDAFPRYIYTWRIGSDGTYREDGRDASSGKAIQDTLSGQWSVEGARMVLRQQGLPYLFDGVVLGGLYRGTLYHNGRPVSRFCAARGEAAPKRCSEGPGVATAAF
jgi:hypothetical protein